MSRVKGVDASVNNNKSNNMMLYCLYVNHTTVQVQLCVSALLDSSLLDQVCCKCCCLKSLSSLRVFREIILKAFRAFLHDEQQLFPHCCSPLDPIFHLSLVVGLLAVCGRSAEIFCGFLDECPCGTSASWPQMSAQHCTLHGNSSLSG